MVWFPRYKRNYFHYCPMVVPAVVIFTNFGIFTEFDEVLLGFCLNDSTSATTVRLIALIIRSESLNKITQILQYFLDVSHCSNH